MTLNKNILSNMSNMVQQLVKQKFNELKIKEIIEKAIPMPIKLIINRIEAIDINNLIEYVEDRISKEIEGFIRNQNINRMTDEQVLIIINDRMKQEIQIDKIKEILTKKAKEEINKIRNRMKGGFVKNNGFIQINNKPLKANKTRCNNKAPWYRRAVPMTRDITFEVLQTKHKKDLPPSYIVRVTWNTEDNNDKELIGYIKITQTGFKINKIPINRLPKNVSITGGTTPPGFCYHFKVDDEIKKKIMRKLV